MDDSELWVPLIEPRADDEDDVFVPLGDPSPHVSSGNGAEDTSAPAPFPTRRLMFSTTEVPDFSRIPRAWWEEAMRTIPERHRLASAQGFYVDDLRPR